MDTDMLQRIRCGSMQPRRSVSSPIISPAGRVPPVVGIAAAGGIHLDTPAAVARERVKPTLLLLYPNTHSDTRRSYSAGCLPWLPPGRGGTRTVCVDRTAAIQHLLLTTAAACARASADGDAAAVVVSYMPMATWERRLLYVLTAVFLVCAWRWLP